MKLPAVFLEPIDVPPHEFEALVVMIFRVLRPHAMEILTLLKQVSTTVPVNRLESPPFNVGGNM
jgi:hypothetical protein